MEIIATSSTKAAPLTTESPIFTTEFRPIEATGIRGPHKKLQAIPSSLEHNAALKALARSSCESIPSLESSRSDESNRIPRAPSEAAIPAKLLENIRMVGRTRQANDGESDGEEEGADPPEKFLKPVEPIKNLARREYARPPVGVPRSFNRSRISSVGTDGRSTNGSYTPKPPSSVKGGSNLNQSSVKELTKEYTKSLAEAVSNLTDRGDRESSQRWNLNLPMSLHSSDEDVEILPSRTSRENSYTFGSPMPKAPPIRGSNGSLTRELDRFEKALTDVENAPKLNGNMGHGWSRLKSNLAVATRINASDRVRDMAVAAASAALLRKSLAAEPTKVPDVVKEMAHAAAKAAAIKKKVMNEKEKDVGGSRTLKAVRPPSSRTLPPDEKPVSTLNLPTNEVTITASTRTVLPGIKRGTGGELSEPGEKNVQLRSALKNGNLQTGSTSSLEDDEPFVETRRESKVEKNITAITESEVDGDTIIGVPSQISHLGYTAARTAHQRLAEQTTTAARVRIDAIRERKEVLDALREGGTAGGKENAGPVKPSLKADEVTKRLTNPTAFTAMSKVRFERSAQLKPPAPTPKKPPANKIDFFSTFTGDDSSHLNRRHVSASMSTLNALPKQISGAKSSTKNAVSGSVDFSTPKLASNTSSNNLNSQTVASNSVDAVRRRRTSSNEASGELVGLSKSDETLRSERRKGSLPGNAGKKSSNNSLRGSSGSLEEETDGPFGMHNRYWPAEERERDGIPEDDEATKLEKRRKKKDAKASTTRLSDKSNYTGVHRFGSMNRLAPPTRSPWNVI